MRHLFFHHFEIQLFKMQDISLDVYKISIQSSLTSPSFHNNSIKSLKFENYKKINIQIDESFILDVEDTTVFSILTLIGFIANSICIILILNKKSLRQIISIFYLHHCFINLIQYLLFIPFLLAIIKQFQIANGCTILSGGCSVLITSNVLNILAISSCEAYKFEDLINTGKKSYFIRILSFT